MADTKISDPTVTAFAPLLSTDVLPVARPGNTTAYKATLEAIKDYTATC